MKLLGAPTDTGRHGVGQVGSVVTVAPHFEKNIQSCTVCPADDPTGATTACGEVAQPSNSLFVRQAPDADAPLILDPDVHPGLTAGTDGIGDWSDRIPVGQAYVVDQPAAQADGFFTSGAVVKGAVKCYRAQFDNRTSYVNAAGVTATEAR
ncbi:hypothetical protein ACFWPQ_09360 [Streptomyces sp. NPDC058464]|uniref:hypothetical protein n=1 Tax=Streptomyces sp. NPDC058464 TaxID=3346511 RepID=UPI0036580520